MTTSLAEFFEDPDAVVTLFFKSYLDDDSDISVLFLILDVFSRYNTYPFTILSLCSLFEVWTLVQLSPVAAFAHFFFLDDNLVEVC